MQVDCIKLLIVILCCYLIKLNANTRKFDKKIKPTIGEIWPKPKLEKRFEYYLIDPNNFEFEIVGERCDILDEAVIRYKQIIKKSVNGPIGDTEESLNLVTKIAVNLSTTCENFPHLDMDESYEISGADYITANSIWGVLRALESYSQAIIPTFGGMLRVQNIKIIDSPRFAHRGLLLDTARHYINIDTILTILDGMAYNKLNVFHWHIVDDESFPYKSIIYPELSEKGAYMPSMVYTQKNIVRIIEYARMRGIRVIPEFDVPAHTQSWGKSHVELLLSCEKPDSLNPVKKSTYQLLDNLFNEIMDVFPDKYIHVGGDEVNLSCWIKNTEIPRYIHLLPDDPITYIKSMFMAFVSKILTQKSHFPIVWQEALEGNSQMPEETIVQVWKDSNRNDVLLDTTHSGYRVLYSQCWYLDKSNGGDHWEIYYNCDPLNFPGNSKQKNLVIGGEACMWSEIVNDENVIQEIYPRVSAIAEKLWSPIQRNTNLYAVEQRLLEHTYRMNLRGIHAHLEQKSINPTTEELWW